MLPQYYTTGTPIASQTKYKQPCFSATKKPKYKFCLSEGVTRPMYQPEHHPSPETGEHHWLPNFKTFKIAREGKQIKSTLNTPFFIFFPEIVPIFLLFSSSSLVRLLINKSNILQKAKVIPALSKDSNMTFQPQLSCCKTLLLAWKRCKSACTGLLLTSLLGNTNRNTFYSEMLLEYRLTS